MRTHKGVSEIMDDFFLKKLGGKSIELIPTGCRLHRQGKSSGNIVHIHKVIGDTSISAIEQIIDENTKESIGTLFLFAGSSEKYNSRYGTFRRPDNDASDRVFLQMTDAERFVYDKSGLLFHFNPKTENITKSTYKESPKYPYEYIIFNLELEESENPFVASNENKDKKSKIDLFVRTQLLYEQRPHIVQMDDEQILALKSDPNFGAIVPATTELKDFNNYKMIVDAKKRTSIVSRATEYNPGIYQPENKSLTAFIYYEKGNFFGSFETKTFLRKPRITNCMF